jgi:hypothetical protein
MASATPWNTSEATDIEEDAISDTPLDMELGQVDEVIDEAASTIPPPSPPE